MSKSKQKQKSKKENFIVRILKINKKILFLFLFLVILPLIVLPIVYLGTYLSNRPKLFKNNETYIAAKQFKNYEKSTVFDINISTDHIKTTYKEDKLDEIDVKGKWTINFLISFNDNTVEIVDNTAKIQIEGDCNWKSCKLTSYEQTLYKDTSQSNWEINRTFSKVSPYIDLNIKMPLKPLPFIRIYEPTIYFKISYETKSLISGNPNHKFVYYYKITPDQLKDKIDAPLT